MNNDLISRKALKKAIMELSNDNPSYYYTGYLLDREKVLDEIDNAPTVKEVSVIEFKEPLPLVKAHKIVKVLEERQQGE
jgi:hypothetical protein